MKEKEIIIQGARQNNLKNINLTIPKNKLIVFTGVSGSGKSSLAFDTIYAEGQRKYVESLSSYARQFIGIASKPDVDQIDHLSPAISIDQKVKSHNPRSTVGTITEIYDYLRLLFARIGIPYCYHCNTLIKSQTISAIIDEVYKLEQESQLLILSPIVRNKRGAFTNLINSLKQDGFLRIRVNDKIMLLDDEIIVPTEKKNNIEIVIDRIILDKQDEDLRIRLRDGLEIAAKYSKGLIKIIDETKKQDYAFSQNYACQNCGFSINELEPKLFSFNSPAGACEVCKGIGIRNEVDIDLLIPDYNLSINEGGIVYFQQTLHSDNVEWQLFDALCKHYDIDQDLPLKSFTKLDLQYMLKGSDVPIKHVLYTRSGRQYDRYEKIEGLSTLIERRFVETKSESQRRMYRRYLCNLDCYACQGQRLNKASLSVKIGNQNIAELCDLSIERLKQKINDWKFTDMETKISFHIMNEINARLEFLDNVGLSYLSLSRSANTLSGGESQRIRLATQIGSKLTGILYVLDEPSIGLHQSDNEKLINTLKSMRDLGNTLIVVEHDESTIENADYIVDIGLDAGDYGGEVIYAGKVEGIKKHPESYTGQYLSGKQWIEIPKKRNAPQKKYLNIYGASEHNLNGIDVKIPLNIINVITGVSGSGKSTLVNNIIYQAVRKHLMLTTNKIGKHDKVTGLEHINEVVHVTQDPIGKTPRSNAATYTGMFNHIRDLFTNTPEAKARGYLKGQFSFNVPGGRCGKCSGDGTIKIEMYFLPDIYVKCDECQGKRYNDETLQIKFKHHNIADILDMTVTRALKFFENQPKILRILQTLADVGLDYIKLGQSATEFSGGEAQRIKIATFLNKRSNDKSLILLDEPTTGLHMHDVKKLISVIQRLAYDHKATIIVIEHNLDVIKIADYIIDLGPGGGEHGGKIVFKGTPEQIAKHKTSLTGKFLKEYFENHKF